MIIKNKDDSQDQIDYLSDLLDRDFPDKKKSLIERELKCLYSGKKGEDSSAYYLDFDFKNTKNWMVIHDLRLEYDGDVAQIDHLIIGRMMDVYVLESKNFNYGVSISDEGDFSYFYNNRPFAIPSPIAQNERHIRFLGRFLAENELLPKRLGITIKPKYRNIILVSPTSRLTKPKKGLYDCSSVMKGDKFLERFKKDLTTDSAVESVIGISKVISKDNLKLFAEKLSLHHQPITINYKAKFGLDETAPTKTPSIKEPDVKYDVNAPDCPKCKKPMIKRSAKKGKNIGNEFWGCSGFPKCRGVITINKEVSPNAEQVSVSDDSTPTCPKCDGEMVKRLSKKGDKAGSEFWGCKKFPKCRGIISL
ncbi:MAG: topoisomerase DNA-binding C4 zinc finger domain-containing protein [Woeseiaceae bacterium]